MSRNKKKTPGRPKKEFVSKKPQNKKQSGPGRPRKNQQPHVAKDKISPEIVSVVSRSVDDSKKKDLIILVLFFLSFILFMVSLYFTFIRDKKSNLTQSEISEIANIETGNIDYTPPAISQGAEVVVQIPDETTQNSIEPTVQNLTPEQQTIVDFYQAVNTIDTATIYRLTDARLEQSNVFKTYYTQNRLNKFSETILAPKIVVMNIEEEPNTSTNPNIKNFSYTLEYMIVRNQQKFTEERSTVLIKKGDDWRIGKLMCETKGCSTMPFFNPDKYK